MTNSFWPSFPISHVVTLLVAQGISIFFGAQVLLVVTDLGPLKTESEFKASLHLAVCI